MGRAERAAVVADVHRASPDLVSRIVADIRLTVPAYRALHDSQLAEVRAIVRWATSRLLRMWVEDTGLTPADTDRARGIGRARAADGRSVDAVVRAYRVGAATADRLIAEVAGGRLGPADVFVLNRIWLRELDALTESLATGHADAAQRLDADRDRALRAFLDDLLTGRPSSPAAIADRARTLGVSLPDPGALLVTAPTRPPRDASAQATAVATGLELAARLGGASGRTGRDAGVVFTARADHAVLLLDAGLLPRLGLLLRELGGHGCLLTGCAPDELAVAYRLARGALETAPSRAYDPAGLLFTAEAHVVGLLSGVPGATPASVRQHVLGRLLDDGNRHLADTLDAYLNTGSATAAAESLHLHPQTLRYRMRRVRELTGRDARDPWQRLMLDIARTIHVRPAAVTG